jgi:putative SOS response-associated peptidase YedK
MCEGFYEWQRVPTSLAASDRSIYFVHSLQSKGVKIEDKSTWTNDSLQLLHIAGIFDVWHDPDRNPLYSFTMLSTASNSTLNWLHPRTPVILESQKQISDWLNFTEVSGEKALTLLTTPTDLVWREVSPDCVLNGGDRKVVGKQ